MTSIMQHTQHNARSTLDLIYNKGYLWQRRSSVASVWLLIPKTLPNCTFSSIGSCEKKGRKEGMVGGREEGREGGKKKKNKAKKHYLALILSKSHFTNKELSPREGTGPTQCHRAKLMKKSRTAIAFPDICFQGPRSLRGISKKERRKIKPPPHDNQGSWIWSCRLFLQWQRVPIKATT